MKICSKCGNEVDDGQSCVFCGVDPAEHISLFSLEHVQLAEKEKRCFICGIFEDTLVSYYSKVILVKLHGTGWNFKICTLCREFENKNEKSLARVIWNILKKRIHDSVVKIKVCRQCNTEFKTTLSKKEFCSDFCRGKFHREEKKNVIQA